MIEDLKYAVRGFLRARTLTAVLMLSLALGTGANAVLYSVMDALLFRSPAGVREAAGLVSVFTTQFGGAPGGYSSYPDYLTLKSQAGTFASLSAFDDTAMESIRFGDVGRRVRIAAVTPEYFATLGMEPHAGTLPSAAPSPAGPQPAVISFSLAESLGDPAAMVGHTLTRGDREYVVAGVAPAGFNGLQLGRACDVWVPLAADSAGGRGDRRLSIVGRLNARTRVGTAAEEARAIALQLATQFPETNRGTIGDPAEPRLMTVIGYSRLDAADRQQTALISVVVLGATAMLLVSAWVNAGCLLLSRSAARRRELAVKVALGATQRRLARQAILESVLLSVSGAALGLLFAHWTARILPAFFAPEQAEMLDTSLHPGLFLLALLLSCVVGILLGIGPARHAAETLDTTVLRADAGGVSERAGGSRVRGLLVTGQVALSTVLLIAAGLMVQALAVALEGDLGPAGRDVAVVLARMPGAPADVIRGIRYRTRVLEAMPELVGPLPAGWVSTLPLGRSTSQVFRFEAGRPGITETLEVDVNVASPGFFAAMQIPTVEGRPFGSQETALSAPVIVVNDVLARRYFGVAAVGHRLIDAEGTAFEIVGVVGSGKYRTLQQAPEATVYFPAVQRHQEYMHLVMRTGVDAGLMLEPLRRQLETIDRGVDIRLATTFEQHLSAALTLDRVMTIGVAGAGIAALLLATVGVYGVIADGVRRRTPEIGLRVALGARVPQVVRLVFSEGLNLTALGAVVGVGLAIGLARVLRLFVFGLPAIDRSSLAIAPVALVVVVAAAAVLPTRRALRISPTVALRDDG